MSDRIGKAIFLVFEKTRGFIGVGFHDEVEPPFKESGLFFF
jgi:hypothetical protein